MRAIAVLAKRDEFKIWAAQQVRPKKITQESATGPNWKAMRVSKPWHGRGTAFNEIVILRGANIDLVPTIFIPLAKPNLYE